MKTANGDQKCGSPIETEWKPQAKDFRRMKTVTLDHNILRIGETPEKVERFYQWKSTDTTIETCKLHESSKSVE